MPVTEPLFFAPILMDRVWGGTRLADVFGKKGAPGRTIGESWELVDRPEAQSVVSGGTYAGRTLEQLLKEHPDIWGELAPPDRFPLLIKYVDAGAPLSVQVHPDDEQAKAFNDRGKSECWVVVHSEPGAEVIRGLKPGTTRESFDAALAAERIEDVLHSFHPKAGDIIALPAGMVHAIGSGLLVAEVQQNSDLTFRVYDYKRMGLDGKPRQLHVKEALSVIRFDKPLQHFSGDLNADTVAPLSRERRGDAIFEHVLEGRYFWMDRWTFEAKGSELLNVWPKAPRVAMALAGSGALGGREFVAGQTVLLPAGVPQIRLDADAGGLTVLVSAPSAA